MNENKKIVLSQFDIDRLQKALNKELKKRADEDNVSIQEKIVQEGRSATIIADVNVYASFNTVSIDYMGLERKYSTV
jgi:hypothetical protein